LKKSIVPYLVKRFLRFDKDQPFIFLSALLAFVGIALGVMVLLIAMALMNGFDKEFKKKLTIMNYPLTVIPKFYGAVNQSLLIDLETKFPTLKFSPYIQSAVMTRSGTKLEGGYIFGVNFEDEAKVNSVLAKAIDKTHFNKFDVLIGKSLKDEFSIYKDDKLMYIFTNIEPNAFSVTPKIKRFKVKSIFDSGLSAYDKAYSYTTLRAMQAMMHMPSNQYDGIHIYSDNPHKDIKALEQILPYNLGAIGWWEQNGNFFSALEMEKKALFLILMLIILVASLNIISSLLMTVMNRRKEIALLLSLGASKAEIKKTFFYLGVIIGGSGVVFGVLLGLGSIFILQNYDIITIPADVYGTSKLPTNLSMMDLGLTVFGAFVVIILSSFYPALKASKIDVLNVLRYE